MVRKTKAKPSYPLKDVKRLIRANSIWIQPNALVSAWDDFGWRIAEIKKCLLKLNSRYHLNNTLKNHFYKTEPHIYIPNTMMDYYKAINIMKGVSIYTHFYIHPNYGTLTISSFKTL